MNYYILMNINYEHILNSLINLIVNIDNINNSDSYDTQRLLTMRKMEEQ